VADTDRGGENTPYHICDSTIFTLYCPVEIGGDNDAIYQHNHPTGEKIVAVRFLVKEVARARGYSMYRLQKETQIDIRILRRLFRNTPGAGVNVTTLDRIATVLGVDISELLESIPDNQTPTA
jgi:DNA-binding Xre family transcriptional regulator